jgi:site-specific DNA-methyltransferase (adenine-specific)
MKYPDDFINQIIRGDCLEVMKEMPDKCVDLVLTDPPYGIGESNEKNSTRGNAAAATDFGHYEWDKERLRKEYFDEIFRISKYAVIFGGNYYTDYFNRSDKWIIWDKRTDDKYTCDFADCELAWTNLKGQSRMIRYLWHGMIQQNMKDKEKRLHPTQKPLYVIKKILLDNSKESDLILDCFSGSGTTAVACKELGRNFIGIEKEPKYVEIAKERLRILDMQPRLL